MKKLVIAIALVAASTGAFARGWHCGPHHGAFHHPSPIHHGWHGGYHHHHYHGGYWGRGGRYFWPGFVGGVVGGVVGSTLVRPYYSETVVVEPETPVVTTPTVVQQPVVVQQQPVVVQQPTVVQQPVVQRQPVWVEGRYVDQVQANGSTVRIWQPGHYE